MPHFGYTSLGFGSGTTAADTGFNIDIQEVEATILLRTGDAVGVIAYGTDTNELYVFDGSNWQIYNNFTNNLSCEFDASNDVLPLASPKSFAGAFSLSIWFKQTTDALGILAYGTTGGAYVELKKSPTQGKLIVSGWGSIVSGTGAFTFGQWSHFMFVRDSSDGTEAWVNGSSIGTATKSGTVNVSQFGTYSTATEPFGGFLDEIAMWESDQSSNVSTIYNSGLPANLKGLSPLNWWRMGDTNPASAGTAVSSVTDVQGVTNLTQGTATKQPVLSLDVAT